MRKSFSSVLFAIFLLSNSLCYAGISYDGTDDYLCGEDTSLSIMPAGHPLSMTALVYLNDNTDVGIMTFGEQTGTSGWRWSLNISGALLYTTVNIKDYTSTIVPDTGEWIFIAVTVDSAHDAIHYYYRYSTATWSTSAVTHTADMDSPNAGSDLFIGLRAAGGTACSSPGTTYMNGIIADLSIYKTALTEAQIHAIGEAQLKQNIVDWTNISENFSFNENSDGSALDGVVVTGIKNGITVTGIDGANNTGLTSSAETQWSYR